ncbi:MAG: DUF3618 domain-containing protein, partial [Shimia sp.]
GSEWRAKARAQQARFRASAAEMQRDVESGLSQFSDDAKHRIRHARQAAIEARYEAEQRARYYGQKAGDVVQDNPLMVGLFAAAIGAAAGAALPRTKVEDEYFGEHSDRLFEQAQVIYAQESEKLKAVATAAVQEGKDVAREAVSGAKNGASEARDGDEAVRDAAKKGDEAANRVAAAAQKEAEKQDLGSSLKS